MAKMKAAMAAVLVMEKEGVTTAFGVPGAAINPLYAQLRERGTIKHILARHVEGASHMAEGYTRAVAGNVGVCIGTSGEFATIGTPAWWGPIARAMRVVCDDDGRPLCKLHGLRMLNPEVFSRLPLASADSTNIGQNIGIDQAWRGNYMPPTKEARAQVMRERIEAHNGLTHWRDERALMTQEVLI